MNKISRRKMLLIMGGSLAGTTLAMAGSGISFAEDTPPWTIQTGTKTLFLDPQDAGYQGDCICSLPWLCLQRLWMRIRHFLFYHRTDGRKIWQALFGVPVHYDGSGKKRYLRLGNHLRSASGISFGFVFVLGQEGTRSSSGPAVQLVRNHRFPYLQANGQGSQI